MLDGGQDVVELAVLGAGVVDRVGDHDRQSQIRRERRRLGHEPVVVGEQVVAELDREAAVPEPCRQTFRGRARARAIPDQQPPADLPAPPAREHDDVLVMLVEQRVAEARDALRAGHVGPRHEPAQAPPADLAPGEQDEPRTARPGTDAAQVLLDRIAMTGEAGAFGAGTGGPAVLDGRLQVRPVAPGRDRRGSGRRRRRRRGGTTMPAGSATAGSSSSISAPMTGCRPASSAAVVNRTEPYRPLWSVAARPVRPSSTARSTSSSGAEAPSRNEKLVWAWSSA